MALGQWLEVEGRAIRLQEDVARLVERTAAQERSLMSQLETYRGIYEELVTAYSRCTRNMTPRILTDLQEWLEVLHQPSPRSLR